MDDINLTDCEPVSREELIAGMIRLREQRDRARGVAVSLEQENAELSRRLMEARNANVAFVAKLTAHGIDIPDADEIGGVPV
jgi:hypothetical protein